MRQAAALLEVVLALGLFFMTAMFVMDGLNSSLKAVQEAKLEADAADLAVSVFSHVQLGLLDVANQGPTPFDEELYPGWTWQLEVGGVEELPDQTRLKRVELILRNESSRLVHRTTQWIFDDIPEMTGSLEELL